MSSHQTVDTKPGPLLRICQINMPCLPLVEPQACHFGILLHHHTSSGQIIQRKSSTMVDSQIHGPGRDALIQMGNVKAIRLNAFPLDMMTTPWTFLVWVACRRGSLRTLFRTILASLV